jgi:hypothetical protein
MRGYGVALSLLCEQGWRMPMSPQDSTMTVTVPSSYEFVGGPYDGRLLDVDPPPQDGVELVVHTVGQAAPAEFYILGSDGRFHYNHPPQLRSLAAFNAD